MEPHLLEGIFEQRLPGHVDLYVTGECIGLKTKTTPRPQVSSEDAVCTDRATCYDATAGDPVSTSYLAQVSEVSKLPPKAALVRDLRATFSSRDENTRVSSQARRGGTGRHWPGGHAGSLLGRQGLEQRGPRTRTEAALGPGSAETL